MATRAPFLSTRYGGYYHREIPQEDAELTRIGPGTPCGEYLRRFWQPVTFSDDLKDLPVALKILGEDLGLAQEAVTLASSSKKEIVAFCDKLFAEPFATLTDAQRAAVAAWCPPMMQTAGVAFDEAEPTAETPEPDSEVAQAA